MAEYIEREALMKNFCGYDLTKCVKYGNESAEQQHDSYSTMMMYEIADEIEDAPTVDAVEVVRCKDCEHFRDYIDRHGVARMYCIKNNHVPNVEPEHYCSYGERKEGAE